VLVAIGAHDPMAQLIAEDDAGVLTTTSFSWDLQGRANRCWPGGSPPFCRR
jgi:hypothetical protein